MTSRLGKNTISFDHIHIYTIPIAFCRCFITIHGRTVVLVVAATTTTAAGTSIYFVRKAVTVHCTAVSVSGA